MNQDNFILVSIFMVMAIAAITLIKGTGKSKHLEWFAFGVWMIYMIFAVGFRNPGLGTDSEMYLFMFDFKASNGVPFNSEWLFYAPIVWLGPLFGSNGGLLVAAMMYAFGLFCAIKLFGGRVSLLLLLFVISGWCFYSSAINVIRSGAAISFTLCAAHYALREGKWTKGRLFVFLLWTAAACLTHAFQVIFILALIGAIFVSQIWVWLIIYFATALASFFGVNVIGILNRWVDFGSLFNDRAESYIGADAIYKMGFRWDFFGFVTLMLLFPLYHILIRKYNSLAYQRLVCYYLISSSAFIASFYISFSDRVGLTAFFLVPFIAVAPLADEKYRHAREDFNKIFVVGLMYALLTFIYLSMGA